MIWNDPTSDDLWIEFRAIKQGKIRLAKFRTWEEGRLWSKEQCSIGLNAYYGMAYRKEFDKGGDKLNCGCTSVLWVDIDREIGPNSKLIDFILPPTTIICSGKGQHIYWELDTPADNHKEIETVLKKLCKIYDGCKSLAQVAAILRVPGTFNYKYDPPRPVVELSSSSFRYTFDEMKLAVNGKFEPWVDEAHKEVESGDRSEHEYKLINQLFEYGFTSNLISHLIKHHTSESSKANEDECNLQFTIDKVELVKLAKNDKQVKQKEDLPILSNHDIFIGDGCYCTLTKEGNPIPISNFVYDLKAIQSGINGSFICDIIAGKSKWEKQLVDQKVFSSALTYAQNLPYAHMVWYGNNHQTMKLKQLLVETWEYEGLPLIKVTKQLGRQFNDKYAVTDGVYDKNLIVQDDILYVEPGHVHPHTALYTAINPKQALADLLKVNNKTNIQTMLGWFVSCYVKPVLAEYSIKFPHLLVCGKQGSGKTTLITEVFQPLAGYREARLWQANSTPFVLLTLLGSTTSVPVCLTEFRNNTQKFYEKFLQMLRTHYDAGEDARGTAGQNTNIYGFSSPVCIDGEELITDGAALERIIPVYLDKRDVEKSGNNLEILLKHDLHGVGAYFLEYTLRLPNEYVFELYTDALKNLSHLKIPQRIKNNYAVINLGLKLVSNMLHLADELEVIPGRNISDEIQPDTEILIEGGKTASLNFLEDLIVYIMSGETRDILYRRKTEKETGLLGFNFSSCYKWWVYKNKQVGKDTPDAITIKRQFKELDDIFLESRPSLTDQGRLMHLHFIDLKECSKVLDIDIF